MCLQKETKTEKREPINYGSAEMFHSSNYLQVVLWSARWQKEHLVTYSVLLLLAYFLSVSPGGIRQDLVLFPEDFKKNSDLSFMGCDRKKNFSLGAKEFLFSGKL